MHYATGLFDAGFADIISVIPPDVPLAPTSRVHTDARGKVPGKRLSNETWVGFGGWQTHETTHADVEQWERDHANIGLRTARFPAIDIDCDNEQLSQWIADIARETLGPAPSRVGRAPKQLLLYRTDQPFKRVRLWLRDAESTQEYLVEVLGTGQQFVAAGLHASTKRPYEWDQDIAQLGPDKLTPIDRHAVARFLDTLQTRLEARGFTCRREGHGGFQTDRDAIDQGQLKAPSIDELRKAVACIPNTNEQFPDRGDYIRAGYAIRGAAQDDLDAGFEIYLDWALQWEGNDLYAGNDPATVRADWDRMRPPYEIGWHYIADLASGHGYNAAALVFEADLDDGGADQREPDPVRYSEQHLADILIEEHGEVLRYMPIQKCWYTWDGVRWLVDIRRRAYELVKSTLRKVADRIARSPIKGAVALAKSVSTNAKVNNILTLASCDSRIVVTPDGLDTDPWLLNTPTGIVDLRTGQLCRHDPALLLTKITNADVAFDRSPTRWLRFLEEATLGDRELQEYLQRLAGYCLTGDVSEHVIAFVHGGGGNGKSVFLNTLSHVLGEYATQAPMSTFLASSVDRHPTEIAALRGARLVAASETDSRGRWNEARLKSLSGGDPLTARFLYGDFFEFQPQFKLVLVGNHKPRLSNVDDAIRRRLHLVPFTHKPKQPDPALPEKLRAEAGPILAWMIAGCLAWQREGLIPPPRVTAATTEYFEDEDAVGRWIAERCELVPTGHATTAGLFYDWQDWCYRLGEDAGSQKSFSQLLKNRGFRRWREPGTRRMGFRGIVLRPTEVDFESELPNEAA
jgi:P4 family phage/plasmid primase-like protien